MTSSPRVVIGMPLYCHADFLRESIEALLTQSYGDFRILAVDDCSTDATPEIMAEYLALDDRLEYLRNDSRLGMTLNWRRCFELATERHPQAEYFAWASDHDLCHPRWLGSLVSELDGHPEAVLAYPIHLKISASGKSRSGKRWRFDTAGIDSQIQRFRRATWSMSAGNMVYGLYRAASQRQAGIFRRSLLPDRLLLAEMSLYGEFRQVPQTLWYRRHESNFSLQRQGRSLFGERRPTWARVPWWLSHPAILGWNLTVRASGRPRISRLMGLRVAAEYVALCPALHLVRGMRRLRLRHIPRFIKWLRSRSKRLAGRAST